MEARATLRIIRARGVAWRTSNAPGPLLAFAFEEHMVEGQESRANRGERETCSEHREGEFVIVHRQIASSAVDFPDSHSAGGYLAVHNYEFQIGRAHV